MSNQLAKKSDADLAREEMEKELSFMIQNGKKLTLDELHALAQFSTINDLNPFANESYYLPGTGPVAGIVGYRKRAKRECENDAIKAGYGWGDYTLDFYIVTEDEAYFNPENGDIAIKAVLHDSVADKRWRTELFIAMDELKKYGVADNYKEALNLVGPKPSWVGYGVVFGSEHFSGHVWRDGKEVPDEWKPEMYDRHERCRKRAEKQAIKKRFPNLFVGEAQGDYSDIEPVITVEKPESQPQMTAGKEDPKIRPYSPEMVKRRIEEKANKYNTRSITDKQKNLLRMCLRELWEDDIKRHACQAYLTGVASTSDMTPPYILALLDWLKPTTDTGGAPLVDEMAAREAGAIYDAAVIDQGQMPLI